MSMSTISLTAAFSKEQLAYLQAHIGESKVEDLYWIHGSAIFVVVSTTILRVFAKTYTRTGVSADDYLVILATICNVATALVDIITGAPNGLGRHLIAITSRSKYETLLLGSFLFTQFNIFAVVFIKIAILTFYYRVFPNATFRRMVLGTIIALTVITVTMWGYMTFACQPITYWYKVGVQGKCLDLKIYGIVGNLVNILSDIWIFLMPIPLLWRLKVGSRKKVVVVGIFTVGSFVCILTILRAAFFRSWAEPDWSWNNVSLHAYLIFEPVGGILCINAPFIARAIRQRIKEKAQSSNSYPSAYSDPPSSKPQNSGSQRRGSNWLRGIDSIHLTGMSSRRRSLDVGSGSVTGGFGPWIPLSQSRASTVRMDCHMTRHDGDDDEVMVERPKNSFIWDDVKVAVRDAEARESAHRQMVRVGNEVRVEGGLNNKNSL